VVHLFQTAHEVISDYDANTLFLEFHGFGSSSLSTLQGQCDASQNNKLVNLSEGRGDSADPSDSTFMHLLQEEISDGGLIRACIYSPSRNLSNSDIYTSSLGGTTNTNGRFTNGSTSDPCGTAASASSQRFIHIEQSYSVRRYNRSKMSDYVGEALNVYFGSN
jgi:hypothetical protein